MAVIYATLIIKGVKTFADVPDKIKDKVREVFSCPGLPGAGRVINMYRKPLYDGPQVAYKGFLCKKGKLI